MDVLLVEINKYCVCYCDTLPLRDQFPHPLGSCIRNSFNECRTKQVQYLRDEIFVIYHLLQTLYSLLGIFHASVATQFMAKTIKKFAKSFESKSFLN